jgi:hypothetical protein
MKTVWKYQINSSGITELYIPDGAEFITTNLQHLTGDQIYVWILCDPNASTTLRKVIVLETGEYTDENLGNYVHTITDSHNYVFHIFEIL